MQSVHMKNSAFIYDFLKLSSKLGVEENIKENR